MADIVLGLASARSPMVNLPPERWHTLGENDKASTRLRRGNGQAVTYQELLESASPAIAEGLTPAYLTYHYIEQLGRMPPGSVVYVPTEGGVPLMRQIGGG